MNENIAPHSSRISRFARWLASPRILGRCLFIAACFITLLAAFYTEENWRGKRAWTEYRHELESKGVNLDWTAHIPPPVPDEQNIFKAPKMAEWFVKDRAATYSNELDGISAAVGQCLERKSGTRVADVEVLPFATSVQKVPADFVLHYRSEVTPRTDPTEAEQLKSIVRKAFATAVMPPPGPNLKGAQDYTLTAQQTKLAITPTRVLVLADQLPSTKEIGGFFPSALFASAFADASVRAEPVGTNLFQIILNQRKTFSASEYLTCSEEFARDLQLLHNALQRPYARREGDYAHPWAIPLPNFVAIRRAAQTISQRAQCHLLLGQPEEALAELSLVHDLHRVSEGKPTTLVATMIHVAVTGLYTSMVADGLRLHAWREPQLIFLQQQLSTVHLLPALTEAFETERIATCRMLETTTASELESIFGLGLEKPSLWSKLKNPRYYLDHWMPQGWIYQNITAIASRNQWFIEAATPTNEVVQPSRIEATARKALADLGRFSPYTFLASWAIPNYLKASQTTIRNQTMINEALVACGLERYRLAYQSYPESLDKLIPQFVEQLPPDISTGKALKYQRAGDRFLLYSVGWNESDDGGEPSDHVAEGDWVWDPPKP